MNRIRHAVQTQPNGVLPNYYHVSSAGQFRSTLVMYGRKGDGLSSRQRKRITKRLRRELKERQAAA